MILQGTYFEWGAKNDFSMLDKFELLGNANSWKDLQYLELCSDGILFR